MKTILVTGSAGFIGANRRTKQEQSQARLGYALQGGGKAQLKSHDVAWRSTARDFNCVNWDSIAREAGLDGEELVACLCTAHQGQAGVVHGG